MKRDEEAGALSLAIFGLLVVFGSYELEVGKASNPGPGFLPFWAGIFLFILSLGFFLHSLRTRKRGEDSPGLLTQVPWKRALPVLGGAILYANSIDFLGFVLATFILMVILFKSDPSQKWSASIGGSLLTLIITYLVFEFWLQSNFPKGLWGF